MPDASADRPVDLMKPEAARRIMPLAVTFWRCGAAFEGRGWSKCTTPHSCQLDGCYRVRVPKENRG